MNKYTVSVKRVYFVSLDIEANDKKEAEEKVSKMLENERFFDNMIPITYINEPMRKDSEDAI